MSETRIDPAKVGLTPSTKPPTRLAPRARRSGIWRARPSIARTGLMRLASSAAMRLAPGDRASGGRGFRPSIERRAKPLALDHCRAALCGPRSSVRPCRP